jgi:hypothetical protein
VTGVIDQNVFRLQITIDNLEAVQALQSAKQFGCVEARSVDIKSLLPLEVMEELSAIHKGQYQVQLLRRLERELEGHDEWIIDLRKHGSFGESVGNFGP